MCSLIYPLPGYKKKKLNKSVKWEIEIGLWNDIRVMSMDFSHISAFLYHRKLSVDCNYFIQYLNFFLFLGDAEYLLGEKISQVIDYFQRKEI